MLPQFEKSNKAEANRFRHAHTSGKISTLDSFYKSTLNAEKDQIHCIIKQAILKNFLPKWRGTYFLKKLQRYTH